MLYPSILLINKSRLVTVTLLFLAAHYFLIGCTNSKQGNHNNLSQIKQHEQNQDTQYNKESGNTSELQSASQDKQYKQDLENMIKSQIGSDEDITESMKIFDKQGGFNASKKRAIENCQIMDKGTSIEELTTKGTTDRVFEYLNISGRSLNSEEMNQAQILGNIYNAEVFAAQANYCPETKKEFKIEG
jgi:uncharacterized FlaG/YvyC family protein